jgi:MraZ protein
MPASGSNAVTYYNSLYRHAVDSKRRLQIPAKWRPADGNIEFTAILWPKGPVPDACLLVLPPDEWARLVQKLKDLPFGDPKAETLRRMIGRKSDQLPLDKAGRICLPEEMAKAAGIEVDKEAVLLGAVTWFEIWNPQRYEQIAAMDEQLLPEALRQI